MIRPSLVLPLYKFEISYKNANYNVFHQPNKFIDFKQNTLFPHFFPPRIFIQINSLLLI